MYSFWIWRLGQGRGDCSSRILQNLQQAHALHCVTFESMQTLLVISGFFYLSIASRCFKSSPQPQSPLTNTCFTAPFQHACLMSPQAVLSCRPFCFALLRCDSFLKPPVNFIWYMLNFVVSFHFFLSFLLWMLDTSNTPLKQPSLDNPECSTIFTSWSLSLCVCHLALGRLCTVGF